MLSILHNLFLFHLGLHEVRKELLVAVVVKGQCVLVYLTYLLRNDGFHEWIQCSGQFRILLYFNKYNINNQQLHNINREMQQVACQITAKKVAFINIMNVLKIPKNYDVEGFPIVDYAMPILP